MTDGRAGLDAAIARAAEILGRSRNPVIAGLGTDIAGAEAAVALASRTGAVLDHAESGAALRNLDAMREAGWLVTTPMQARAEADLVLLAGPGLGAAWPEMAARLALDTPPSLAPERGRRVIRLCPGREASPVAGAETVGGAPAELPATLAGIRALAAGRPVQARGPRRQAMQSCAEALLSARYGVAVWTSAALDALAIEMLCGLIDDLNARTRFAGLPVPAPGNAAGVGQAIAWHTGFPFRTGFPRGAPEHDPWRFDATRMVESGEADAALWVSTLSPTLPPWKRRLPLVALVPAGTRIDADVTITVGRPGQDHDTILFDGDLATLAAKTAAATGEAPPAAAILARIAAALPGAC